MPNTRVGSMRRSRLKRCGGLNHARRSRPRAVLGEASLAKLHPMNRHWEHDALRGLMLVLMTLTHLPTRWSDPLGQPFGFVSAAEGFVFLSAYLAGKVYTQRNQKRGEDEMRGAFLRRALKIYACQVALLAFAFTVIAALGLAVSQPAVTDMLSYYINQPWTALAASLLLLYNPPLLDILPMYILFMVASPVVLLHGLRNGWGWLFAISLVLWVAAQFEVEKLIYALAVAVAGLRVPLDQTGAFELVAWQFLWLLGLWMGAQDAAPDAPKRVFPPWMVMVAWAYAVVCLVWRHAVGQSPFPAAPGLNMLFDKWRLGPLRLIDFMVLLLLTMHHGERLKQWLPRSAFLETLGRAALPVFCAHLVAVLLALALVGAAKPERHWGVDLAVLLTTFLVLWTVARATEIADERTKALREKISVRRRRRSGGLAPSPGAPQ